MWDQEWTNPGLPGMQMPRESRTNEEDKPALFPPYTGPPGYDDEHEEIPIWSFQRNRGRKSIAKA